MMSDEAGERYGQQTSVLSPARIDYSAFGES